MGWFHMELYLGRFCLMLYIPFINLFMNGSSPKLTDFLEHMHMNILKAERAVPIALYFNPESSRYVRNSIIS